MLCTIFSCALLSAVALGQAPAPAAMHDPLLVETPPLLPQAIASFGAALSGSFVYVYGGHVGRAHQHSKDNAVGTFWRLDLRTNAAWEELPSGPPLQGTALVAHAGVLFRVGGVAARNASGAAPDMHSTASVQRFDPASRAWSDDTPLPEPRSSHDAWVLDGKLYVVGGWKLDGSGGGAWHDTAWVADLGQEPLHWQPLPEPPFHRRALAVAAAGSRLAVIGGITDEGKTTSAVSFYDPARRTWTDGPDLPGSGFGAAATTVDDVLYLSAHDGALVRLSADGTTWQPVRRLAFPRFFHRLVPRDDHTLLALGGAGHAHLRSVELLPLESDGPLVHEWRVDVPSSARNRMGILQHGDELVVFGGNRSPGQHDFEREDFTAEAFVLDLSAMAATALPEFPRPMQSMTVVQWGRHGEDNVVVGGFGHDGEVARSRAEVVRFDFDAGAWQTLLPLPAPRTQLGAAAFGGRVWVVGGADYDPRREGGASNDFRFPSAVLSADGDDLAAGFGASGLELPGPRRAFGTALLGSKLILIGGMKEGFAAVARCDVLDLASRTWSTMPAPTPRISPEVATIGDRIYVAGGSSPTGDGGFAPNPSLDEWAPERGWRTVVATLPFSLRHVRMLAHGDDLLFVSCQDEAGVAVIDLLHLGSDDAAVDASMRR